jgi:hypothetical protein
MVKKKMPQGLGLRKSPKHSSKAVSTYLHSPMGSFVAELVRNNPGRKSEIEDSVKSYEGLGHISAEEVQTELIAKFGGSVPRKLEKKSKGSGLKK